MGGRDLGEVERLCGGIEWGGVGGIGSEWGELIEVRSDADDIQRVEGECWERKGVAGKEGEARSRTEDNNESWGHD